MSIETVLAHFGVHRLASARGFVHVITKEADMAELQLLTDAQASQTLAISRSRFHQLVASGEIRRLKLGRAARYRSRDIEEYIDRLASESRQTSSDESEVEKPETPQAAQH